MFFHLYRYTEDSISSVYSPKRFNITVWCGLMETMIWDMGFVFYQGSLTHARYIDTLKCWQAHFKCVRSSKINRQLVLFITDNFQEIDTLLEANLTDTYLSTNGPVCEPFRLQIIILLKIYSSGKMWGLYDEIRSVDIQSFLN